MQAMHSYSSWIVVLDVLIIQFFSVSLLGIIMLYSSGSGCLRLTSSLVKVLSELQQMLISEI